MARIRVEIVCALPAEQHVVTVELEDGATAEDAVRASGLNVPYSALGSFGRTISPDARLKDGDRVELLRPLAMDPKEARRRRARRRRR